MGTQGVTLPAPTDVDVSQAFQCVDRLASVIYKVWGHDCGMCIECAFYNWTLNAARSINDMVTQINGVEMGSGVVFLLGDVFSLG